MAIKDQQQQFSFNSQAALIYYIEEIINKWNETNVNGALGVGRGNKRNYTFQRIIYDNFSAIRTQKELNSSNNSEENFSSEGGSSQVTPPDITSVEDPKLFSLIGKTPEFSKLFSNFSPALRDSITCNVEVYKTFIINNKEYDWKIPLNEGKTFDYSTGKQKTSFEVTQETKLHLNSYSNSKNVSISSFSYEFKGVNDFDINTNLQATLELIFDDPTVLLEKNNVLNEENAKRFVSEQIPKAPQQNSDSENSEQNEYFFCFSDFISNIPSDYKSNKNDLNMFRIKVVIFFDTKLNEQQFNNLKNNLLTTETTVKILDNKGFSSDASKDFEVNLLGFNTFQDFKRVLNNCSSVLYLIPHSHDITINQDNKLTIKINYIASNHGLLHSPEYSNILNISSQMQALNDLRIKFDEKSKQLNDSREQEIKNTKIAGNLDTEEKQKAFDEKLKEKYKTEFEEKERLEKLIQLQKSKIYSDALNKIINSDLYVIKIPNESLGIAKNTTERAAAGAGGAVAVQSTNAEVQKTNVVTPRKKIDYFFKSSNFTQQLQENLNISSEDAVKIVNNSNVSLEFLKEKAWFSSEADIESLKKQIEAAKTLQKKNLELDKLQTNKEGYQTISFIFLGDLLDVILECLSSITPDSSRPVLIFSHVTLDLPEQDLVQTNEGRKKTVCINIADIPISFNLLTKFWSSLVESRPDFITVHTFFYELIERLLKPVLGPEYFNNFNLSNKIKIGSTSLSIPNYQEDGVISNLFTGQPVGEKINKILIAEKVIELYKNTLSSQYYDNYVSLYGTTNYIFFYDVSKSRSVGNNGDEQKDIQDGIYHFSLNTANSIIKRLSFSKIENNGLKEGLAIQDGSDKNLIVVKQAYKVEIDLIPGLTIYKPGDMIFVDPYLFSNEQSIHLSNALGFVGYYLITSVKYNMSKTSIPTATLYGTLHAWLDKDGKSVSIKGN